jgi:23S rRNA pseudouridine2605 synthase
MTKERLQKILSAAGAYSRRKCEELILEGAVAVNGKVVDSLPAFADPDTDEITVDGRRVTVVSGPRKIYWLLNKPKGVVCTNIDPQHRPRAIDLVPVRGRIFCVGRLDIETTGLIILTNDGELANKLTHPRYKLTKTYVAQVKGQINPATFERLKKGVWLAEGRTSAADIKILKQGKEESLLEIRISQGLNRQVRRMLAKVGLRVKTLKRTQIGKISIRGLGVSKFRPLTSGEIAYLHRTTLASEGKNEINS